MHSTVCNYSKIHYVIHPYPNHLLYSFVKKRLEEWSRLELACDLFITNASLSDYETCRASQTGFLIVSFYGLSLDTQSCINKPFCSTTTPDICLHLWCASMLAWPMASWWQQHSTMLGSSLPGIFLILIGKFSNFIMRFYYRAMK